MPDAGGEIVLHLLAPLVVAGVEEFLAVTGRGPEVGLKNRVATVCQKLCVAIVAPGIAAPRPAMREDDEREILRLDDRPEG